MEENIRQEIKGCKGFHSGESKMMNLIYYINKNDGESEQNSRLDMTWKKSIKNQDKKLTKRMGNIHRQEKQDGYE